MSGISRLGNKILDSLGFDAWGNRDVIPNDFNSETVETNQEFQYGAIDASKIKNLSVDTITVSTTGYIKSGKDSFTDSTNAGYYFSADGIYMGASSDATYLKYDIGAGTFTIKAAVDGASTIGGRVASTLASAIDASGHFADSAINTATGTIVTPFSFGVSGALQIGTYSAGVSGDLKISPNGILARDDTGATTFSIDGTTGVAVLNGLVVGTNVGLGTAQDSAGVTTIIGDTVTTGFVNALNVNAATVSASISITSPTITGGTIAIGTGDSIFKADSNGIYLGDATFASAPFRVNMQGQLYALDVVASNLKLYDTVVDAAGNGDYLLLSEAIAAGKKNIFIRNGNYTETATISITTNTYIQGESADGVVITFTPAADDTLISISNPVIDQKGNVYIGNITFTCNDTYTNLGITGSGRYIDIDSCIFYDWTGNAIELYSGSFTVSATTYYMGWYSITNCNFYNNEKSACYLEGYELVITDNKFRNNYTTATTRLEATVNMMGAYSIVKKNRFDNEVGSGIMISGFMNQISENVILYCGAAINDAAGITTPYDTVGWQAELNNMSNNTIRYCPIGIYFGTTGGNICYQSIISGNLINSCRRGGIIIQYAQYARILGNQLNANTTDADNTYNEITVDNSDYVTIANNFVLCSSTGTQNAQYGLRLTAGSDSCEVLGNHIFNAQTANLSDAGATNDIAHNIAP